MAKSTPEGGRANLEMGPEVEKAPEQHFGNRYEKAHESIAEIRAYPTRREYLKAFPHVEDVLQAQMSDPRMNDERRKALQGFIDERHEEIAFYEERGLHPTSKEPWYKKIPGLRKIKSPEEKRYRELCATADQFERATTAMHETMDELSAHVFEGKKLERPSLAKRVWERLTIPMGQLFDRRQTLEQRKRERFLLEATVAADRAYRELVPGGRLSHPEGYETGELDEDAISERAGEIFDERATELGLRRDEEGEVKTPEFFRKRMERDAHVMAESRLAQERGQRNADKARKGGDADFFLESLHDYQSAQERDIEFGSILGFTAKLDARARNLMERAAHFTGSKFESIKAKMEKWRQNFANREKKADGKREQYTHLMELMQQMAEDLNAIRGRVETTASLPAFEKLVEKFKAAPDELSPEIAADIAKEVKALLTATPEGGSRKKEKPKGAGGIEAAVDKVEAAAGVPA